MPVHDWGRVEAGIFHHFHQAWIGEIARALNAGLLPPDFYALAEQFAAGFGPDVLTLQAPGQEGGGGPPQAGPGGTTTVLLAPTKVRLTARTDMEYYRAKQSSIAVRHVSGDRIIAVVEVVSPGNKAAPHAMWSLIHKATQRLDQGVHLLFLDLHPPGRRDPYGLHAAIWEEVAGEEPGGPARQAAHAGRLRSRDRPGCVCRASGRGG
jgi:hypothetical protein